MVLGISFIFNSVTKIYDHFTPGESVKKINTHLLFVLFQVSFVFTNQVDGKLVPIESMVSPKIQGAEGNENNLKSNRNLNQKTMLLSQRRKPLESILSKQDFKRSTISAYNKPLPRATVQCETNSLSCSVPVQDLVKPKPSIGYQLPQKRLSPDKLEHDDYFH